jgi:hypothetical protein
MHYGPRFLLPLIVPAAGFGAVAETLNLDGKALDPFASAAEVRIFVLACTDCPIANRDAPELKRLSDAFTPRGAVFSIVYADPAESSQAIWRHIEQRGFPGSVIQDPAHSLARHAKPTVTPEAAVFSPAGKLLYHSRIDNGPGIGKALASQTRHDLDDAIVAAIDGRPQPEKSAPAVNCSLADVE